MKRLGFAFLTGATVVILLASSASAAGRPSVIFSGTTSQGHRIVFVTQRTGDVRRVKELEITGDMTCPLSGDEFVSSWQIGFFHGPVLQPGTISIDFSEPDLALHIHGTLTKEGGSGSASFTEPQLTPNEQGEACTSGEFTWTVTPRRSQVSGDVQSSGAGDSVVHEAWGDISISRG